MKKKHSDKNGYTLVEIMIVVTIIGLLVAIAFPNLLRARVSANEGITKGNIRTLLTAIENFRTASVPATYPPNLAAMAVPGMAPPYIDTVMAGGIRNGYQYTYVARGVDALGNFAQFTLNVDPINPGITGNTSYFVDESGIIRSENPGPANAGSPPL